MPLVDKPELKTCGSISKSVWQLLKIFNGDPETEEGQRITLSQILCTIKKIIGKCR